MYFSSSNHPNHTHILYSYLEVGTHRISMRIYLNPTMCTEVGKETPSGTFKAAPRSINLL